MEEIAMGFTPKQYGIIEKIVQQHIQDWKAEEARNLRMKDQLVQNEKRFQENLSKSNRNFNQTFRISVLICSIVIAVR